MRDNKTIGGTDIAAIVGLNPYKSPIRVWLEKTGREPAPDLTGNERAEWGKRLEPLVAEKYRSETGRTIFKPEPEQIFHPSLPWYSGSPDYIVKDENALLEIKTTDKMQRSKFAEGVPDMAFVQGVWYARLVSVTFGFDVKYIDFPILIGGNEYLCHHRERDKEMIDLEEILMEEGENFWTKCVLADTPPEIDIDGSDRVKSDLAALWRKNEKEHILTYDTEVITIVNTLNMLKADQDQIETEITRCENFLKSQIRDAAGFLLPDGSRIDWKAQAGNVSWKSVAEALGASAVPALVESFRGKEKRVFKTYFKETENE